jgi:hypothetical protein
MLTFGFWSATWPMPSIGSLLREWLGARANRACACAGSTAAWRPCPGAHCRLDGHLLGACDEPGSCTAPATQRPDASARPLAGHCLAWLIFALTLPMTRLAVGTPDAASTLGRGSSRFGPRGGGRRAVDLFFLAWSAARRWPRRSEWLAADPWPSALGVVFGFPLCTSVAMRHVEAVHASVIARRAAAGHRRGGRLGCTGSGPSAGLLGCAPRWAPPWWWRLLC